MKNKSSETRVNVCVRTGRNQLNNWKQTVENQVKGG